MTPDWRVLALLLSAGCAPTRAVDDDRTGGDPCGGEPCEVTVTGAAASCGEGTDTFTAEVNDGSVTVWDGAFSPGCCPDFTASAVADGEERTVLMTWNATNDFCDCICLLDATATVTGLPAGAWTFRSPAGEDVAVTLP